MSKLAINPKHPERICWGCERLCPVNHLGCRETRVEHPVELFGIDWLEASGGPPEWQAETAADTAETSLSRS